MEGEKSAAPLPEYAQMAPVAVAGAQAVPVAPVAAQMAPVAVAVQAVPVAPVAGPIVAVAPNVQVMSDDYTTYFANQPGTLISQKWLLKNYCACTQQFDFDVGYFPQGHDLNIPWEDGIFQQHMGLMNAHEESECCDKCMCGGYRAFKMHIHPGAQRSTPELLTLHRPFKCTVFCCFKNFNPQELTVVETKTQQPIGRVVQDVRCEECICSKQRFRIENPSKPGEGEYYLWADQCCNENCCAPSLCFPTFHWEIRDTNEQVVGSVDNFWPGCNLRGVSGKVDNYRIIYPPSATPQQKAAIFSSVFLVDFLSADPQDDGGGMGAEF